jgi:hypothetical protein
MPLASQLKTKKKIKIMNDIRRRRYNMFLRIRTFGSDNAADFPANSSHDCQ